MSDYQKRWEALQKWGVVALLILFPGLVASTLGAIMIGYQVFEWGLDLNFPQPKTFWEFVVKKLQIIPQALLFFTGVGIMLFASLMTVHCIMFAFFPQSTSIEGFEWAYNILTFVFW